MYSFLRWLGCLAAFTASAQPAFKTSYPEAVAYSAVQTEPFQFFKNAASLAWNKTASAGFYGERRFNLSELFFGAVAATLPAGNSHFGLGVQNLGNTSFRHSRYSLAYAHTIGPKAAVGASFGYQQISISGYGSLATVSFSAGVQMRVTNQLLVGCSMNNPSMLGKKYQAENAAPANIDIGFGYDVSDALFLTVIITKTNAKEPGVQAACQYLFDKKLLCRIGIETTTEVGS